MPLGLSKVDRSKQSGHEFYSSFDRINSLPHVTEILTLYVKFIHDLAGRLADNIIIIDERLPGCI